MVRQAAAPVVRVVPAGKAAPVPASPCLVAPLVGVEVPVGGRVHVPRAAECHDPDRKAIGAQRRPGHGASPGPRTGASRRRLALVPTAAHRCSGFKLMAPVGLMVGIGGARGGDRRAHGDQVDLLLWSWRRCRKRTPWPVRPPISAARESPWPSAPGRRVAGRRWVVSPWDSAAAAAQAPVHAVLGHRAGRTPRPTSASGCCVGQLLTRRDRHVAGQRDSGSPG